MNKNEHKEEFRCEKHKDKEDFENNDKLKFIFFFEPKEVTQSIFNIKLSFLVKIVAVIYAYRASKSFHKEIQMYIMGYSEINKINLILNGICIFASILIYFSMQKKNINFINFGYYVYLFHYFIKLFETFIYVLKILTSKNKISAIFGSILGLGISSIANFLSTWIMFSQKVYCHNINKKEKVA